MKERKQGDVIVREWWMAAFSGDGVNDSYSPGREKVKRVRSGRELRFSNRTSQIKPADQISNTLC